MGGLELQQPSLDVLEFIQRFRVLGPPENRFVRQHLGISRGAGVEQFGAEGDNGGREDHRVVRRHTRAGGQFRVSRDAAFLQNQGVGEHGAHRNILVRHGNHHAVHDGLRALQRKHLRADLRALSEDRLTLDGNVRLDSRDGGEVGGLGLGGGLRVGRDTNKHGDDEAHRRGRTETGHVSLLRTGWWVRLHELPSTTGKRKSLAATLRRRRRGFLNPQTSVGEWMFLGLDP